MKHDIIERHNFLDHETAAKLTDFRKYNSPHTFEGSNDFFENKSFPANQTQDTSVMCICSTLKYRIAHVISKHYNLKDVLFPDFTDLVQWHTGDEMGLHGDNAFYPSGDPNYVPHRTYSAVVYLNDDYEGGQTYFADGPEIEVEVGKMIAFPADIKYAHGVKKILSGQRYTLALWYTDSRDNYEI